MTFARRLTARRVRASLCPFLGETAGDVEKTAAIAEIPRPVSGKSVSIIKPCITDSAKVMGEAQLVFTNREKPALGFFDAITMKYLLGLRYPELRFSFKLGSASLQLEDGAKALVFENGYLSVREVRDAEALDKNINLIAILLRGAAICPHCASAVVESTLGGCGRCITLARPALTYSQLKYEKPDFNMIKLFRESLKQFDSLLKVKKLGSKEASDRVINSLLNMELERDEEGSKTMQVISLFWSLYRAIESKSQHGCEAELLLQKTWDSIMNSDRSELRDILTESRKSRSRMLQLIKSTGDRNLVKPFIIANSAFYITSSLLNSLGKS